MRQSILGQTGVKTSSLGFGCTQLTSHRDRRDAVRILEHAFALGITHFDVARSYGFGRAEGLVAEFLRDKRNSVTVATKFGLQPPAGLIGKRLVIETVKKVLGPFPGLLRRAKKQGSAMTKSGIFSAAAAVDSLSTSLRELGTDYVDVLLLHEATLADAASEALIETLERLVARGTVRCLGIASDFDKLRRGSDQLPMAFQVVQFNHNAVERNLPMLAQLEHRTLITYSTFKPNLPVCEAIKSHPAITQRFSSKMNVDLHAPDVIASLLLDYAVTSNASGVVLFSSTDPTRVGRNVREAESPSYNGVQLSYFLEFLNEILKLHSIPIPTITKLSSEQDLHDHRPEDGG